MNTYRKFDAGSKQVANALMALGWRSEDRVAARRPGLHKRGLGRQAYGQVAMTAQLTA